MFVKQEFYLLHSSQYADDISVLQQSGFGIYIGRLFYRPADDVLLLSSMLWSAVHAEYIYSFWEKVERLRNDLYCVEWDVKLYYNITGKKWNIRFNPGKTQCIAFGSQAP